MSNADIYQKAIEHRQAAERFLSDAEDIVLAEGSYEDAYVFIKIAEVHVEIARLLTS